MKTEKCTQFAIVAAGYLFQYNKHIPKCDRLTSLELTWQHSAGAVNGHIAAWRGVVIAKLVAAVA